VSRKSRNIPRVSRDVYYGGMKFGNLPMDASLSPAHNNIVYRSEYDVVIFISIQNSNLDMSLSLLDSHKEALLLEMNNLY
jgi:hypothetical protein